MIQSLIENDEVLKIAQLVIFPILNSTSWEDLNEKICKQL